jgi:hypothetical protein
MVEQFLAMAKLIEKNRGRMRVLTDLSAEQYDDLVDHGRREVYNFEG